MSIVQLQARVDALLARKARIDALMQSMQTEATAAGIECLALINDLETISPEAVASMKPLLEMVRKGLLELVEGTKQ